MNLKEMLLFVGAITAFGFVVRNLLNFVFALNNYNMHKERLRQLQFKRKDDMDLKGLIELSTVPAIKYIIPRFKFKNKAQLDEEIKFAKWDKVINAEKYYALSITFKIVAILIFLLLRGESMALALIWFFPMFFGFDFLFKMALTEKKEELMSEFPSFIRKVSGFISSSLSVEESFRRSQKYVGPQWEDIVKRFVAEAELRGVTNALALLKEMTPLFEVKEFANLISLSLSRTGNIQESFENQIEKINELQNEVLLGKIAKRQLMALAIQAPLLLCGFAVIIIPTMYEMMNLSV